MTDLTGKHALVTGGGTGVGAAIAKCLSDAGASVTVAGRRPEPLRETARRLPGAQAIRCDVTDPASVERLFAEATEGLGAPEIVVANAGAAHSAPFASIGLEEWNAALATNLTGTFLTAKSALPPMRATGWGRLIFVASTAGLKGYRYVAPYVAAKHGVVGLARALALETARAGITVNAVCPGFTDTDMLERSVEKIVAATGRSAEEARASLAEGNPQGRFVEPAEVANAVLWLCSDGAAAVTGQAISVSGGET
jgi:3-hydroxybutyrate dehydrogenase